MHGAMAGAPAPPGTATNADPPDRAQWVFPYRIPKTEEEREQEELEDERADEAARAALQQEATAIDACADARVNLELARRRTRRAAGGWDEEEEQQSVSS